MAEALERRKFNARELELLSLCRCDECPLRATRNPVLGAGGTKSGLVIVGEAPGRNEDELGYPFRGQAGALLNATLKEVGLDRGDVYSTNAVLCRPAVDAGGDTAPPPDAIRACRPRLVAEIKDQKPKWVVTLGNTAIHSMVPELGQAKISSLVGSSLWAPDFEVFIAPSYHPAAVLRGMVGLFDDIISVFRRSAAIVQGRLPLPPKSVNVDYVYITEPFHAKMALELLCNSGGPIAVDVETDDLRYMEKDLLLVSMSTMEANYVFDAKVLGVEEVQELLMMMFEDPRIEWVLHNMSFDFRFLRYHYGAVPNNALDTMAMALGTTERSQEIGLKRLSREYLGAPYYEQAVDKYFRVRKRMSDVPIDILVKYAAMDTYFTIRLPAVLAPLIEKEGTWPLVQNILIPAQRLFADLSYTGVLIDQDYAGTLKAMWMPIVNRCIEELQTFARENGFDARAIVKAPKAGSELNPRSSKQLIHLFYDLLGFEPPTDSTRQKAGSRTLMTGKRTTSGDFLIANEHVPAIVALTDLRTYDKAIKTYVDGVLDDVWIDGRVHPDFKLAAATTGRIAITNPPLQTIPHWGIARLGVHATEQMAAQIRRLFISTPGYLFFEVDYSQLELRTAWHYSRDKALGEALMTGDFHSHTASAILHKPLSEVTKQDRFTSKFVTFGVIFGRQAVSLAMGELQCTVPEAQAYIDHFWEAYPQYKRWWDGVRKFVRENGYIKSSLGRKRRWNLFTKETMDQILNQAVNMPVQSLASDLCLTSAVHLNGLFKKNGWGRVLYLVHDSIVFEIKEEFAEQAGRLIEYVMTRPQFPTCATFEVESAVGHSWSDAKVRHFETMTEEDYYDGTGEPKPERQNLTLAAPLRTLWPALAQEAGPQAV